MCKPFKEYLGVLRDYKPEVVMVIGFVAAGVMYHDMRTYIDAQTRTLTEINMRLLHLEQSSGK